MSLKIEDQSSTVAFMKEIFSYMNSSEDTHSLLESIHRSLKSVIYAENFYVVLLNSNKRFVTFPFYRDVKDSLSSESLNEVPLEEIFSTLTFYAIKKKNVVVLTKEKIKQLLALGEFNIIGTVPEQWLCFPLQHKGVYFGNFVVQSYRSSEEYSQGDIDILSYISGVIATALFLFNKNMELEEALLELSDYKEQLEVKIQQRTSELEHTLHTLEQEINKGKMLETQLRFEVFHDNLTQLYNRKFFVEQLEIVASQAGREQHPVILAYMDLDGFKEINDTHGHECGDMVLKEVAQRLNRGFRRHDIVARFGGDEFVILFTNYISYQNLMNLFERLITQVSQPIRYHQESVSVGISVGLAISCEEQVIKDKLLHQADSALYQVKKNGKGGVEIYQTEEVNNFKVMETI